MSTARRGERSRCRGASDPGAYIGYYFCFFRPFNRIRCVLQKPLRSLVENDWERCRFYFAHVKRIGYRASDEFKDPPPQLWIDPCIIATAQQYLLPSSKIRGYRCAKGEFNFDFISPLLSPHLRAFEIADYPTTYLDHTTVLHSLTPLLTSIRVLRFHGRIPFLSSALTPLIASLEQLEVFYCPSVPIPHEALRLLATSSTLRELTTFSNTMAIADSIPESGRPFPRLEHLAFHSCSIPTCADLVKRLEPQALRSIEITYHPTKRHARASDLYTFFDALRNHSSSPDALTSVDIHLSSLSRSWKPEIKDDAGDILISLEMIRPLFVFHNLEKLVVDVNCELSVDEVSIGLMMESTWTKMRSFFIPKTGLSLDGECIDLL
jgi:hypothetical protein